MVSLYFPELRKGSKELKLRSLRHLLAKQLHAFLTSRKKMNHVVACQQRVLCCLSSSGA